MLRKNINILARCANNPDIEGNYWSKFPIYSSCIKQSIEAGKERFIVLQGAVESMDEILESNDGSLLESSTFWHSFSPEVRLMILEHLSNDDLAKLQHNDELKVEGAYAIYEE
ncbi:PRANC domain-containing protein [Candidatus Orientia mediorientalis]|uniref:PRANC domain-containing protein n=1 Tax=Candidatus Orientia mediorientalis TaxID=911112 RepID=UPI001E2E13E7|nr:PRANC domain-containing protein [Candidatus Orientia mediorientalis]